MSLRKYIASCIASAAIGYLFHGYLSVPAENQNAVKNSVSQVPARVECYPNEQTTVKQSNPSSVQTMPSVMEKTNSSMSNSGVSKNEAAEAKHDLSAIKLQQNLMKYNDPAVAVANLSRDFDSEAVDANWAQSQETFLTNTFIENKKLAGIAVKSTICKTDKCQIVLAASSTEDANKNLDLVFQALREKNESVAIVASPDVQKSTTTLYVSRDGKDFEFK